MKKCIVLMVLLSLPGFACPGCWKAGNPWQSAQDPGGMQLDTLRKHFARSRYDQPIQVERPSEEVQPVQPPVRREDGVPVPVSSPARGPQSPALEGKRKPAR